MPASIDDAFRRFQRTGAPDALAAVFDGSAAELLRVASHLTHDLHAAEELVQSTFLVAIEERLAFQAPSGVLPWLLGILVNRAHRLRRDAQRSPDPERLARSEGGGPCEAAAASELSQAVTDAVAALPEPYRPVLTLHLRQRLNAREIALALVRPPGTVRTQIARGLDLLRQALPAGLAVGAAVASTPAAGLAAMRATVLREATHLATTTATAAGAALLTFTGMLTMKKILLVAAALLAVASLTWLVGPWSAADGQRTLPAVASGADTPEQPAHATAPSATSPAPIAAGRTPVAATAKTREPGRILGRCVDEAGKPIAGASIQPSVRRPGMDAQDSEPARSDAEGRFTLTLDPAEGRYEVTISAGERVEVAGGLGSIAAGQTLDLGDIVLETGCTVRGRLVDGRGVPQPRSMVSLTRASTWNANERLRPQSIVNMPVGQDGGFSFRHRLSPGSYQAAYLLVATGAWTNAQTLTIAPGQREATVEILCVAAEDRPSLSGRVVDAQGVAVEGVALECWRPPTNVLARARSGADGSFRFVLDASGDDALLGVSGERMGVQPMRTEPVHRPGTTDVTLVVQRLVAVEIVAVAEDSGAAVEEFGLRFFPDPLCFGGSSQRPRLREAGKHEGGRVRVMPFRLGRHLLVIEPTAPGLAPTRVHIVEVGLETPLQRVEVPRLASRTLQVVHADGTPAPGTRIELAAPSREIAVTANSRVVPADFTLVTSSNMAPSAPSFPRSLAQFAEALLLQAGTTDAAGQIVLRAAARNDLALHLRGPGHLPLFVPRVDLTDPSPLRVEVPAAGRVEGTVRPVEVARLLRAKVRLISAADPRQQVPEADIHDQSGGFAVRDDGTFACEAVPPGDWRVHLVFRHSGALRVERIGHVAGLRAGETRRFEGEAGHLRPGHLQASVLLDRAPPQNARVTLRGAAPLEQGEMFFYGQPVVPGEAISMLQTDAHGAFAMELMPGRYRLALVLDATTAPMVREIVCPDEVVIAPGARVDRSFELRRLRVRVRVVAAEGKPIAGRPFLVNGGSIGPTLPLRTDADGVLVIDPAPLGPFYLEPLEPRSPDLATPTTKIRLGPIDVPAGKAEFAVELTFPAR